MVFKTVKEYRELTAPVEMRQRNARYRFTRPFTKKGNMADWYRFLNELYPPYGAGYAPTLTYEEILNKGKYITYQALRESGYLEVIKTTPCYGWRISPKGIEFINAIRKVR
jgi:hypothetical protein